MGCLLRWLNGGRNDAGEGAERGTEREGASRHERDRDFVPLLTGPARCLRDSDKYVDLQ